MSGTLLKIGFDTSELKEVADKLARFDRETLARLRTEAVKTVSLNVRQRAVEHTVGNINVTPEYVNEKIDKVEQVDAPTFSKAIVRSAIRGTTLQRFGARVATQPVRFTNPEILRITKKAAFVNGRVYGPLALLRGRGGTLRPSNIWTERRGDASRNIPVGSKSAGVAVDVNRKGEKVIRGGFILPLRNDNGFGVFRWENGKLRHLYGPSVYQVFRHYIQDNEEAIADELRDEFLVRLERAVEQTL